MNMEEAAGTLEKLQAVYEAARGLCHGHDWNEGTQAKLHGYRNKLIKAVDAIEKLPDAAGVSISAPPRSP